MKNGEDYSGDLSEHFYHQVVKGSQIENYISEKIGVNLKPFFDQYLRDTTHSGFRILS